MHASAMRTGASFFEQYWRDGFKTIVDIGSYDVNGSLRCHAPEGATFVGVDIVDGPGVDLVKDQNGVVPLPDASVDVIVCTSVFEHDDFFWETFLDVCRLLKDGGLIYLNAPSNGWYHLHPLDCWRFYPDAGIALMRWARRKGHDITLIESFVHDRVEDRWNDFVAVFGKGTAIPPREFLSNLGPCSNIWRFNEVGRVGLRHKTQDMLIIEHLQEQVLELRAKLAEFNQPHPDGEPTVASEELI